MDPAQARSEDSSGTINNYVAVWARVRPLHVHAGAACLARDNDSAEGGARDVGVGRLGRHLPSRQCPELLCRPAEPPTVHLA